MIVRTSKDPSALHAGQDIDLDTYDLSSASISITAIKSGATQIAAGAAQNELWRTSSHATLPDNIVMIGN